jgi:hypothetical protein
VTCKPVGEKRKSYPDTFRTGDLGAPLAISLLAAITAQRFCSISVMDNLIGCDGISETTMWKKCAPPRNFAHARTFPFRHAGANSN